MSNPSKRKGTDFETLICTHLKNNWSDNIERLTQSGAKDRGDVANFRVGTGQHLVTWELKNKVRLSLGEWVEQARLEAVHYGAVAGGVIHKRKGKGQPGDQYVTMTLDNLLVMLHAAAS